MSRDIKFRGKRVDNDEWVYGFYYEWWSKRRKGIKEAYIHSINYTPEGLKISDEQHCIIPETVGEYTGLKDCQGKEIYEGDIIMGSFGIPPSGVKSVVSYDGSAFMIKTPFYKPKEATLKMAIECLDVEVIGNIYENPALLEASK